MTSQLSTEQYEDEVRAERARQDAEWGVQNHPDGTGGQYDWEAQHHIDVADMAAQDGVLTFADQFLGDVYSALCHEDPADLRKALITVEAVARGWREAIDRREARPDGAS